MTQNTALFDNWIRTTFVALNTDLENLYFDQEHKINTKNIGQKQKEQLLKDGNDYIIKLLKEGNTDEGFDAGFDLLGNVGFFMAACRRHEIDEADGKYLLQNTSSLAMQLGASLGVIPRFATSHLTTHNTAKNGVYKSFTSLKDEYLFIDYNTLGIESYKRAADAILRVLPLGISHPIAAQ